MLSFQVSKALSGSDEKRRIAEKENWVFDHCVFEIILRWEYRQNRYKIKNPIFLFRHPLIVRG